jgi:hypothetical protein
MRADEAQEAAKKLLRRRSAKAPRTYSIDTAAPEPEKNDTPPAPQAPGISPEPPSTKRRGRPPRVQQARTLLQEQLADGPKPGALVEAAAEKADIAKAELIRATDALGVCCRRGQWWLPG